MKPPSGETVVGAFAIFFALWCVVAWFLWQEALRVAR